MVKNIAEYVVEQNNALRKGRGQWMNLWQELADVLLPARADFVTSTVPGQNRTEHLFDGTPMQARRGLATAIDGLLKPRTQQWFFVRVAEEQLASDENVRRWLGRVQQIMWNAIYSRRAKFIQRSGEVDNDLVTFGTGVLFIGENSKLNELLFRSIHLKDVAVAENSDGIIDSIYIEWYLSPRQAAQQFGEETLSKKMKDNLREGRDVNKKVKFIWCVAPREDYIPKLKTNTNMPFASYVIEAESKHMVRESGYPEFPFAVPRWETSADSVYGRSPGMIALPDAKTLQAMGKTILVAGQKAVDPPMWAIDDSVIGPVRTFPGGISIIDADAARNAGFSSAPLGVLDVGRNIPLGFEMQNLTRNSVEAAFFRNIFNLPVNGPQMTATEVMERREDFMRTMGPVLGQLETDYIGQIVERVFNVLMRAGRFPEPPEVLLNQEIKFEFQSPIVKAKKQIDAIALSSSIQLLAPLIQYDPTLMDNFDGDAITRDMPDTYGLPIQWLRTLEQREGIRQGRQQQQQEAAGLQQLQQATQAAKTGQEAMSVAAEREALEEVV